MNYTSEILTGDKKAYAAPLHNMDQFVVPED